MATRTFASMVPDVAPSVTGAPAYLVEQHIRKAAIRACEETLLWRYMPPTYRLLPGVYEYFFTKPEGTEVHAIFEAMVNDSPLVRLTLEEALCQYPAWADIYSGEDPSVVWSETPPGTFGTEEYNVDLFAKGSGYVLPDSIVADGSEPRSICQLTPDKYVVLPMPDNDEVYTMRMFCALKPSRTSTGMDENVLNELEHVVVHGALQELLILPGVHWNDRELATYHAKQFRYRVSERRARANLGNARASLMARGNRFA